MKRTITGMLIIAVVAMVTTLVSCDLLFSNVNIFSSLDGPNIDELSKADGPDLVSLLKDNKGGENGAFGATFVARLEENPKELESIKNSLQTFYKSPDATPNQVAEAAALYAELTLLTTDTGDAVNGIVGAALAVSEDPDAELTMDSVISNLFGSDSAIGSDEDAFIDFADEMRNVADAYSAVGAALDGGADIELGLETGQAAVVSLVFVTLIDSVDMTSPALAIYTTPEEAVYNLLINPVPGSPFVPEDLFGASGATTLADNMTLMTEDPSNTALFDASGITDLLDLMGLSDEEPVA